MKILRYLYARFYQLMCDVGNGDIPILSSIMFMTFIITLHIQSVLLYYSIIFKPKGEWNFTANFRNGNSVFLPPLRAENMPVRGVLPLPPAPEPGDYRLGRLDTGKLVQRLPQVQQVQHRDAAHGEARRQLGIFLRVDLDERRTACQHFRRFSHHRCE